MNNEIFPFGLVSKIIDKKVILFGFFTGIEKFNIIILGDKTPIIREKSLNKLF